MVQSTACGSKARQPDLVNYSLTPMLTGSEVASQREVKFGVFTAVTMKNFLFWDVTPCDSFKNRGFRGMHRLHHHSG
jgi:hypothetical protein